MKIVILGLSITSSWGNGHATTYRGLVRELAERGHEVLFLEREQPWYAQNRDLPRPPYGNTRLYQSLGELRSRFVDDIREADCVIVGSFVPEGIALGEWITRIARGVRAFYDIDTPVTLANVERDCCEYLSAALIARYDVYLSFTGGPTLQRLRTEFDSPRACALHCSVDPTQYFPEPARERRWALGYLGTFSEDRQSSLERLLLEPARSEPRAKMVVAGPQYPATLRWPANVERIEHLAPADHRAFYNGQRFTLNITRADMARAGYSPSVRLFEAAACGTPIITDPWKGLHNFFAPGREILVANTAAEALDILRNISPEQAREIGERARARVLAEHTAARRAAELEAIIQSVIGSREDACALETTSTL